MEFEWSQSYSFSTLDFSKIIVVSLAISVLCIVGLCKIYKKAGKPAWGVFVPFYNFYLLFDILYKNGWKFLLLFIPFYNIYLFLKIPFRLANMFGRGILFGFGLLFFPFLFYPILGFGKFDYIYHTVPVTMLNSMNSSDNSNGDKTSSEEKNEYVNPMIDTLLKSSHAQEEISVSSSETLKKEEAASESAVQTSFVTISDDEADGIKNASSQNVSKIVGGNPINSELSNAVNFIEFLPNPKDNEDQVKMNDLLTVTSNTSSVENTHPVGVPTSEVVPSIEATPQNFSANVVPTPVSVENVQQVGVQTSEVVPSIEATPQNFSANVVPTPVSVENVQPVGIPTSEVVPSIEATPQNFSANVVPTPVSVENVQPVSVPTSEVVPSIEVTPQNFNANVVQTPNSVENVQPVGVQTSEVVPSIEVTPQNFSANVVPTPVSVENVQPVSVQTSEVVPSMEAIPQNFNANVVQTPNPVENVQPVSVSTPEVVPGAMQVPVESINPVNIIGLEQTSSSFMGVNESSQQFDFVAPVLPPMIDASMNNTVEQVSTPSVDQTTDVSSITPIQDSALSFEIPSISTPVMNTNGTDSTNNQ